MTTSTFPVHVEAHLDPKLNRWLWLVKWLLVIPHYLVLVFLWLAFVVLSVVAFFAILFTGRYPRGIFDFNVGVLRWSWRVAYYAYGALGTDRYPPFSLQEQPDYPAHLEIDYPEHLSRGLVLVKWWLLAIPHYIVVGLFLGGAGWGVDNARDAGGHQVWTGGLIALLVLVAGVVLLFTQRYPQPIFDLVLGLNRWVLRVAGYASLMTDQYPPFRLDQGGDEPTVLRTPPGGGTAPAPGVASPTTVGAPPTWTAGRIMALVLGSLLLIATLGFGAAGGGLAVADATVRDDAGYLMGGQQTFTTDAYAITSTNLELHADGPSTFLPHSLLGDAKVTARARDGAAVFVGVARTADVEAYLGTTRHAVVRGVSEHPTYDVIGTAAPASPPGESDIWTARTSGSGTRTLTWPIEEGDWTVVVMNADASAGVDTEVTAGATVPVIHTLIPTLLAIAAVGLIGTVVLFVLALRPTRPTPAA